MNPMIFYHLYDTSRVIGMIDTRISPLALLTRFLHRLSYESYHIIRFIRYLRSVVVPGGSSLSIQGVIDMLVFWPWDLWIF